MREGEIQADDGVSLWWRAFPVDSASAEVAFLHGYGDHSGRYLRLFERWATSGFSVHALDCRGHGRSGGRRGFVSRFGRYVDDVERWLDGIVAAADDRKLFLIGHSHGALIVARLLQERSLVPAGVVFASPYLGLALRPSRLKVAGALAMGRIVPWLPVDNGIGLDQLSRDRSWQEATMADPLYHRVATPRWFVESNAAQLRAMEEAARITAPSLVLLPEEDSIAAPVATRRFFEALGSSDKTMLSYPGARHELFHEVEETRERVCADLEAWIRERS